MIKTTFNFSGLFPECRNEFDKLWFKSQRDRDRTSYSAICSDFRINIQQNSYWYDTSLENICIQLLYYLNYIDSKIQDVNYNLRENCIYFYYKLKYIVHKYGGSCGTSKNCYNVMRNAKKTVRINISDVCMQHFTDIDEQTLKIIEILDEIYNWINLFTNRQHRSTKNMRDFKRCFEKLEQHPYKNRSHVKEELEKIIEVCEGYRNSWKSCPIGRHALDYLTHDWIQQKRMNINRTYTEITGNEERLRETLMPKALGSDISMSYVIDDVENTGIKPKVWKLRRKFYKNKKNNVDFMYSFDVEHKNTIDDRYKIAYS
ncbi:variable surface protein [Plasmodium gonderi]|uniref:Variable surface protein n=1 Tax=Plasmodium gonderi TaxID=77519 RepID=A0A1Y1JVK3_PLAGO|nr:variable surface protein [Plasmodium gonderi]GAW83924.1 variable surface protein [Plasmodium gonderi]